MANTCIKCGNPGDLIRGKQDFCQACFYSLTADARWRLRFPGSRKAARRKYYMANRVQIMADTNARRRRNPAQTRLARRLWKQRQYRTNPVFRIAHIMRERIRRVLRGAKNVRTEDTIGGAQNLRDHIEAQLPVSWTWENHGTVWEIDHIKPISKFDLTDPQQLRAAFHYTNTQPLSCADNMKKGCHYLED